MDIIAALEATVHCDGRPPVGGIDSTNIFVTFESANGDDDAFTAYGRVGLRSDNRAIIVPQFIEDIEDLGIRNLKAGDTFTWPCGCESIVTDLADLVPAFSGEYDVEVRPSPQQETSEVLGLMMLAEILGIDTSDTAASMRDLLSR